MDRLESMSTFVAVVEAGGFSAAARRLGMPLATVSRKISELEDHLRVPLLTRTTRRVALTEIGQQHFETCRRLLDELTEAERMASGEYHAPRGELVVAAPIVFGRLYLTPIVAAFLMAYPEVDVELRLSDRPVHLAEEGVDLALRIGHLPDSSMMAVRIGAIRHVVCASPDYLAAHGAPAAPEDLTTRDCVTFTGLETLREWTFRSGNRVLRVPVRSRLAVNTAEAAADAAMTGLGITRLLCYQVSGPILDGRLALLLRDFEPEPLPASFVYQSGRLMPQKLKAFLDFVLPRIRPRMVFDA